MSEKLSKVTSLYVYSLKNFVKQIDLTVTSLDKMCHLRLLPPAILSDIYREVSTAKVDLVFDLELPTSLRDENETKHSTEKETFIFLYNKINLDLCCCRRVASCEHAKSKIK